MLFNEAFHDLGIIGKKSPVAIPSAVTTPKEPCAKY
jgi:hypothetical protein